jgi:hypothetical protein
VVIQGRRETAKCEVRDALLYTTALYVKLKSNKFSQALSTLKAQQGVNHSEVCCKFMVTFANTLPQVQVPRNGSIERAPEHLAPVSLFGGSAHSIEH